MKLKKGAKIGLVVVILVALILIGVGVFLHPWSSAEKDVTPAATVESNIENYGYELKSTQSTLYKELFKELETLLNEEEFSEEDYVTLITKLFISDFYTLSNKLTNMDIGGVQFVYQSIRDNFVLNAENTMYQYVQSNIYGDREQVLPEVSEILTTEVEVISYEYLETSDSKAYQVKATWSYKEDLGYETEKTFIFVHEDNKLSLVEMK